MLAVAERAFADRGFHGASVDAIAEGSGISKPMIYAYFGSKEGLYRACMERARTRLLEALAAASTPPRRPTSSCGTGCSPSSPSSSASTTRGRSCSAR